ncbi:MAG: hypothetical protein EXS05_12380 [Planctomycetaceae bacterium]|nr:hypothetical protein [Planctomycetaceae bacterium]
MQLVNKLARQLAPLLFSPQELREAITDQLADRDGRSQAQPSDGATLKHEQACQARQAILDRIEQTKEARTADEISLASADAPDQRLLFRQRLSAHGQMLEMLSHDAESAMGAITTTWHAMQNESRHTIRRALAEWRAGLTQSRDASQARLDVVLPAAIQKLCGMLELNPAELQSLVRDLFKSSIALEADASRNVDPHEYVSRVVGMSEAPNPLTYDWNAKRRERESAVS